MPKIISLALKELSLFDFEILFQIYVGGGGRGKNLKQTRLMQDADERTCQIW